MSIPGTFITFEGPEGSGKSTQIRRLVAWLEARGIVPLVTREPGGTPTGELIRNILQHYHSGESIVHKAEVLLFAASRAQHVERVILPALARGEWVICDRYIDSTTAYQGAARGLEGNEVDRINRFATGGLLPHATVLMDVDPATADARMSGRQQQTETTPDSIERESREFHRRVREAYLELARHEPNRILLVDAIGDEETVFARILTVLAPHLV
jgi:dTMP kinase